MSYDVRTHWNDVANAITTRNSGTLLAGYDSPLDRFIRRTFLKQFLKINFADKNVAEIGSGSGLNLKIVSQSGVKSITAIDISEKMLELAKKSLGTPPCPSQFIHMDGKSIPLADQTVDITFTVTVLQHNSDVANLKQLATHIARITKEKIYLFEDTAKKEKGTPDYMLRTNDFYKNLFEANGFKLVQIEPTKIYFTLRVFSLMNRLTGLYAKKEGGATPLWARLLQYPLFPLTTIADKIPGFSEGNTMFVFERKA